MFKDKLKQLRLEHNLTQADIAKVLGVSPGTIGNYEQGTREPRNNEMWKKLADLFGVSVDYLMDKEEAYAPRIERVLNIEETEKEEVSNPFNQFQKGEPIIYDGIDITSLVFSEPGKSIKIKPTQMVAYTKFRSRSGHVLYARMNLLSILQDIKDSSNDSLIKNLEDIVERLDEVVYWYKRCWTDIDDIFPEVTSLETLYDLIDKCLVVDMIATTEFTLIPLEEDFSWLRQKLKSKK